ncbi:hypothetical protein H2201_006935 [Coniosporium apollinis]|uniref:Histone-lysine N-methyltransferase ASH1L n=2 Tax=Coniosporium TaxID=2810619 RepID=A0ABQ9NPG8_9PEZI|nr:hypothetical protein H2199_005350 [Cladosporium sp. JES 115]KAJ9660354.1 hypothetical protein H2201_006935 [Coniosporium apollinis]
MVALDETNSTRDSSPESTTSTLSCITVMDRSSTARNSIAASDTPPTSVGETSTDAPDASKSDNKVERRRSGRVRQSIATYNDTILAGTAIHTPRKYLEAEAAKNRTVSGDTLVGNIDEPAQRLLDEATEKLDPAWDLNDLQEDATTVAEASTVKRRESTRLSKLKGAASAIASAPSALRKRTREAMDSRKQKMTALGGDKGKIMQSTEEEVDITEVEEHISKRKRISKSPATVAALSQSKPIAEACFKKKTWQNHGMYIGQSRGFKANHTEAQNKQEQKAAGIIATTAQKRENWALPLPMFTWEKHLMDDPTDEWFNFELPYEVYNTQGRKIKPHDWHRISKNRYVGDAARIKPNPNLSVCECDKWGTVCDENCHNRVMRYECDDSNCKVTAERCTNRQFAELKRRTEKKENKREPNAYDVGVEVMPTRDRGFGVRAARTFDPGQIIVEYTGEVIDQNECDRRMREEYANNQCFYIMRFENKLFIDATKGSIARFVNHSCAPNCEMSTMTVNGEPRMALFAGPNGIGTGEELTYDYNFEDFGDAKTKCLCGAPTCRGTLGKKESLAAGVKRKAQNLLDAILPKPDEDRSSKRRKVANAVRSQIAKTTHAVNTVAASATQAIEQSRSREARLARRHSSGDALVRQPGKLKKVSANARQDAPSSSSSSPPPRSPRQAHSKRERLTTVLKSSTRTLKSTTQSQLTRYFASSTQVTAAAAPAPAPQIPELDFGDYEELAPQGKSGGRLRPTTMRPGLQRPQTSASMKSVAATVRSGVVRSVRGPRKAAAMVRYGLQDGAGSGETIRRVLVDDE